MCISLFDLSCMIMLGKCITLFKKCSLCLFSVAPQVRVKRVQNGLAFASRRTDPVSFYTWKSDSNFTFSRSLEHVSSGSWQKQEKQYPGQLVKRSNLPFRAKTGFSGGQWTDCGQFSSASTCQWESRSKGTSARW